MNKLKWSLFFIILLISCLYPQDTLKHVITTYGKAEMKVPADMATLSFSVISEGSTLRNAVDKAKAKAVLIIKDLLKLGLNEDDISTSRFSSGENFGDKSFFSSKSDYKAEIVSYLKVDSLELLESILLTLSDHQPDRISNIAFSLKNPEDYKIKVFKRAIEKAKEKALILANVMNVELGKPLLINETGYSGDVRIRGIQNVWSNEVIELPDKNAASALVFGETKTVTALVELQVLIK